MWCMVIALIGPTSFQWNREKFNEHLPLSSRQYVPLVASERCGKWWVSIWESISLAILEFLKKKEREREWEWERKKYRVDQHSRDDLVFFDFAINYRICERSARIPMWNRVKLRIAHHLTAFFLFLFFSFTGNLLCRMFARFSINRDSIWVSVRVQISRWWRWCGVIFSSSSSSSSSRLSFTLCQL